MIIKKSHLLKDLLPIFLYLFGEKLIGEMDKIWARDQIFWQTKNFNQRKYLNDELVINSYNSWIKNFWIGLLHIFLGVHISFFNVFIYIHILNKCSLHIIFRQDIQKVIAGGGKIELCERYEIVYLPNHITKPTENWLKLKYYSILQAKKY